MCAGCGAGDGAAPDADLGCEGTPPVIEDCPRGFFFAECGGAGEPRLACARRDDGGWGDCYWFTGGCVASGFTPSTCDADYVCCHEGWPYPDGDFPDVRSSLRELLYGSGGPVPWDRARAMDLPVAIDPALAAAVVPAWSCEGPGPAGEGPGPCEYPGEAIATLGATLSITSQYRTTASGWNPLIEIDLATRRARVCAWFYTDVPQQSCTSPGVLCADAGTVTLSRLPTTDAELPGLSIALDVTFASGYHFAGSFAMP